MGTRPEGAAAEKRRLRFLICVEDSCKGERADARGRRPARFGEPRASCGGSSRARVRQPAPRKPRSGDVLRGHRLDRARFHVEQWDQVMAIDRATRKQQTLRARRAVPQAEQAPAERDHLRARAARLLLVGGRVSLETRHQSMAGDERKPICGPLQRDAAAAIAAFVRRWRLESTSGVGRPGS